jgi:hypothetical protein
MEEEARGRPFDEGGNEGGGTLVQFGSKVHSNMTWRRGSNVRW